MAREINQIYCSCGGIVAVVDTTSEEDKQFGCGAKNCCVRAYVCKKCQIRWTFSYYAPEPRYDD